MVFSAWKTVIYLERPPSIWTGSRIKESMKWHYKMVLSFIDYSEVYKLDCAVFMLSSNHQPGRRPLGISHNHIAY